MDNNDNDKKIDEVGLSPKEVEELILYIQQNNSWEKLYECSYERKRIVPKYFSMIVDTRTNDVWRIEFTDIVGIKEHNVIMRTENGYNLKEKIYSWLNRKMEC